MYEVLVKMRYVVCVSDPNTQSGTGGRRIRNSDLLGYLVRSSVKRAPDPNPKSLMLVIIYYNG